MPCDSPIPIKYDPPLLDGKGGFIYSFPADCGKCLGCLKKRKQQWSYRLTEELRNSFSAYFVTLTYDEYSVPWSDYERTASVWDHKQYIKELKILERPNILALRDEISQEEFKRKTEGITENEKYLMDDGNEGYRRKKLLYFGVIEYGDLNCRPHYHYIIFNVVDKQNLSDAWKGQGRVQIDDCNVNTIDYVLKYMVKHPDEKNTETKQREKAFMSKGLGKFALNGEIVDYIKKPEGNMLINTRTNKVPLPRYYRKKYLTEDEAKRKNRYIADLKDKEQRERQKKADRFGVDLGLSDHKTKEAKHIALKNRQKRKI